MEQLVAQNKNCKDCVMRSVSNTQLLLTFLYSSERWIDLSNTIDTLTDDNLCRIWLKRLLTLSLRAVTFIYAVHFGAGVWRRVLFRRGRVTCVVTVRNGFICMMYKDSFGDGVYEPVVLSEGSSSLLT